MCSFNYWHCLLGDLCHIHCGFIYILYIFCTCRMFLSAIHLWFVSSSLFFFFEFGCCCQKVNYSLVCIQSEFLAHLWYLRRILSMIKPLYKCHQFCFDECLFVVDVVVVRFFFSTSRFDSFEVVVVAAAEMRAHSHTFGL